MHSALKMAAMAGVAGVLSAAPASAEGFLSTTSCRAASFATCAGARITMAGPDLDVRIGREHGPAVGWGGVEPSISVRLDGGQFSDWTGRDRSQGSQSLAEGGLNECWSEERTGYRERVECPSLVTPEPISMTLMATGLAGMSGMGWLRRRKQSEK